MSALRSIPSPSPVRPASESLPDDDRFKRLRSGLGLRLLALFAALAGCATTAKTTRPQADGALTIKCAVPDARIYVDDAFVARAAEAADHPLRVRSGTRRVEVRADGWFTAYRDVEVPANAATRVDIDLRKVPDGEPGG